MRDKITHTLPPANTVFMRTTAAAGVLYSSSRSNAFINRTMPSSNSSSPERLRIITIDSSHSPDTSPPPSHSRAGEHGNPSPMPMLDAMPPLSPQDQQSVKHDRDDDIPLSALTNLSDSGDGEPKPTVSTDDGCCSSSTSQPPHVEQSTSSYEPTPAPMAIVQSPMAPRTYNMTLQVCAHALFGRLSVTRTEQPNTTP
jgi:hypothetical protein